MYVFGDVNPLNVFQFFCRNWSSELCMENSFDLLKHRSKTNFSVKYIFI